MSHLAGLDELVVIVVHRLPDLLGAVGIQRCQVSTKLVDAFFCHTLGHSSTTYEGSHDKVISMLLVLMMCWVKAGQHHSCHPRPHEDLTMLLAWQWPYCCSSLGVQIVAFCS